MVRRAVVKDAPAIHDLIKEYAKRGEILNRPVDEIYRYLRDYFVYDEGGSISGVSALHIYSEVLAEIRSLAVKEGHLRKGIGSALVNACLEEAGSLGVKKVFALTYIPDFFKRLGFKEIDKSLLPQKIWRDCITCKIFPECDETAVIKEL